MDETELFSDSDSLHNPSPKPIPASFSPKAIPASISPFVTPKQGSPRRSPGSYFPIDGKQLQLPEEQLLELSDLLGIN
jgi:hypothetical protein